MAFGRPNTAAHSWIESGKTRAQRPDLKLDDGSRVAVIGGGPAGSLFSYYLLDLAEIASIELELDLYDPQDFIRPQPTACNMCGGIVSETLVQNLAADGINLPPTVIQRGLEAYVLHMNGRKVRIETPLQEKRIGSVHRGTGPRKLDPELRTWKSFDGHLQELAIERGARPIREKVKEASWEDGRPTLTTKGEGSQSYDLVAVAVGINSPALKLFESAPVSYELPKTTKTFIREYYLGEEWTEAHLGNAMHVFLLNIPGLEFAAIIPKLNCATVCMLGDDIDKDVFQAFIDSPEVRNCMPPDWEPGDHVCQCSPRMNIGGSRRPFGDRIVFIGDSGVTRLYKDGIGAAYRSAKAAARTAVFVGVSSEDFERHFLPTCASISGDNRIGRLVFRVTGLIQKRRLARETVLRMVMQEQADRRRAPRMSTVLWDMFTGSATYREILFRALHPVFMIRQLMAFIASLSKRDTDAGGTDVSTVASMTGGGGGQA